METTEKIDQDVVVLHEELDRGDGKRHYHLPKRTKTILGIVGLLFVMFLFGMLTRPTVQKVVVSEVPAVLDMRAPRVFQPELNQRITALYAHSKTGVASIPTLTSSATVPRILTWTPESVGKTNPDGSAVPLVGSYEVPAGWFGAIHITADGKEIGVTYVDARTLAGSSQGRFSILPMAITGDKVIHIAFDAVKACRITCATDDQLCIATNVNFCTALYDNQAFDTYTPTLVETVPQAGSCTSKTFAAGPKYSPQIPEDYTMCEKGMWNTNLPNDVRNWLLQSAGLPASDVAGFMGMLNVLTRPATGSSSVNRTPVPEGAHGNVMWNIKYVKGDSATKQACTAVVELKFNCGK